MFSSLDKVDLVLEPSPEGGQQFVQLDFRSLEEMETDPELSAFFALVRVLNPIRSAEVPFPKPLVVYGTRVPVPGFLRQVVEAAGGVLALASDPSPDLVPVPVEGPPLPLDGVIQTVMADLARSVAAEYEVALDLEGLARIEKALAAVVTCEEDETAYWTVAAKLGCFGGEVIRAKNGGSWKVAEMGALPLRLMTPFRGDAEATLNPLGKAIKFLGGGEGDSVHGFAKFILGEGSAAVEAGGKTLKEAPAQVPRPAAPTPQASEESPSEINPHYASSFDSESWRFIQLVLNEVYRMNGIQSLGQPVVAGRFEQAFQFMGGFQIETEFVNDEAKADELFYQIGALARQKGWSHLILMLDLEMQPYDTVYALVWNVDSGDLHIAQFAHERVDRKTRWIEGFINPGMPEYILKAMLAGFLGDA